MGAVFKKDGKYLRHHESTTHTGTHRTAEWVDDLQRATVFHSLPPYRLRHDELKDAEKLEATETRTVTLTPNAEFRRGEALACNAWLWLGLAPGKGSK